MPEPHVEPVRQNTHQTASGVSSERTPCRCLRDLGDFRVSLLYNREKTDAGSSISTPESTRHNACHGTGPGPAPAPDGPKGNRREIKQK